MGVFEAAVTPGLTLMTGFWYTRNEIPLRQCVSDSDSFVFFSFYGLDEKAWEKTPPPLVRSNSLNQMCP